MAGLEKILGEIETAAQNEAESILAEAKKEADGILSAAKETAESLLEKARAEAEEKADGLESAAAAQHSLALRKRVLETKREIIDEVIKKARQELSALPEEKYFALLIKLASSSAAPGEGVVLLSKRDKKRLPPDFTQKLKAALPEGTALTVSEETRDIGGGLILKYGNVEQNCSFEAIFSARYDEFSDMIHEKLFSSPQ